MENSQKQQPQQPGGKPNAESLRLPASPDLSELHVPLDTPPTEPPCTMSKMRQQKMASDPPRINLASLIDTKWEFTNITEWARTQARPTKSLTRQLTIIEEDATWADQTMTKVLRQAAKIQAEIYRYRSIQLQLSLDLETEISDLGNQDQ